MYQIIKSDLNETVWCIPTGNNARHAKERYTEKTVSKVGRKYAYLDDYDKIEIETGKGEFNSGCIVFKTEQDALSHIECLNRKNKINKYLNFNNIMQMDNDVANDLYDFLIDKGLMKDES